MAFRRRSWPGAPRPPRRPVRPRGRRPPSRRARARPLLRPGRGGRDLGRPQLRHPAVVSAIRAPGLRSQLASYRMGGMEGVAHAGPGCRRYATPGQPRRTCPPGPARTAPRNGTALLMPRGGSRTLQTGSTGAVSARHPPLSKSSRLGRRRAGPALLVRHSVRHRGFSGTREALPEASERASDLGVYVGGGGRI